MESASNLLCLAIILFIFIALSNFDCASERCVCGIVAMLDADCSLPSVVSDMDAVYEPLFAIVLTFQRRPHAIGARQIVA